MQAGNEQLEHTAVPFSQAAHLMASSIPKVEIPHHADAHGAWRPHGKVHAGYPVNGHGMGAHFLINCIVDARCKFLQVFFPVLGSK